MLESSAEDNRLNGEDTGNFQLQIDEVRLLQSERILREIRPNWSEYFHMIFFNFIVFTIVSYIFTGFFYMWTVLFVLVLIYVIFAGKRHKYILTNQRFIEVKGLFLPKNSKFRILDIQDLDSDKTLIESFTDCGHITFAVCSTRHRFGGIPEHESLTNAIQEQKHLLERGV